MLFVSSSTTSPYTSFLCSEGLGFIFSRRCLLSTYKILMNVTILSLKSPSRWALTCSKEQSFFFPNDLSLRFLVETDLFCSSLTDLFLEKCLISRALWKHSDFWRRWKMLISRDLFVSLPLRESFSMTLFCFLQGDKEAKFYFLLELLTRWK